MNVCVHRGPQLEVIAKHCKQSIQLLVTLVALGELEVHGLVRGLNMGSLHCLCGSDCGRQADSLYTVCFSHRLQVADINRYREVTTPSVTGVHTGSQVNVTFSQSLSVICMKLSLFK